jgi:prepilin-type processing-associated H-X9-DG protein
MAVAADRNPWLPSPGAKPRNFKAFNPNGPREAIKAGNTLFHQEDGQNVLFMDGHSVFEKSSTCGLNNDNIYTSWSGSDIKKGTPPTLKSQPADPNDSLLLHDPPIGDFK